jgi:hypothetical protein
MAAEQRLKSSVAKLYTFQINLFRLFSVKLSVQCLQRKFSPLVKRPVCSAYHSIPSSDRVKNAWSHNSTPPYALMACCFSGTVVLISCCIYCVTFLINMCQTVYHTSQLLDLVVVNFPSVGVKNACYFYWTFHLATWRNSVTTCIYDSVRADGKTLSYAEMTDVLTSNYRQCRTWRSPEIVMWRELWENTEFIFFRVFGKIFIPKRERVTRGNPRQYRM